MPASSHRLIVASLIAFLASASAAAQQCESVCRDPTKTCICVVAPPAAEFALTRVGAQPESGRIGVALDPGDQVASLAPDTIVELACPGGSEVKLHGTFHAVVLPSINGQDCAFNLRDGNADVLARMPVSIDAGEVVMGSITTQFGMRIDRAGQTRYECVVFEGMAQGQYRGRQPLTLAESTQTNWQAGVRLAGSTDLTREQVAVASRVYARTDVARLAARGVRPANEAALLDDLNTAYLSVLGRPRDVEARVRMASLQTNLGNSRQVLYQVEQAERIDPAGTERNVEVAALKYGAYVQLGQQDDANVQAEKIRTLDATRYNQLLNRPEAQIPQEPEPVNPRGAIRAR